MQRKPLPRLILVIFFSVFFLIIFNAPILFTQVPYDVVPPDSPTLLSEVSLSSSPNISLVSETTNQSSTPKSHGKVKGKTQATNTKSTTKRKSNPNAPNRTIVILIGNLRCGEKAWNTLYQNILDVNKADLALIVGDTDAQYRNASLFQRAKYIWRFQEYDDWADALDLINGSQWRQTVLPQISQYSLDKGLLGGVNGTPSSGAIQGMAKYWLSQHIREEKLLDKYDTFAVTRTDQFYLCPHSFERFGRDIIWVPSGEHYSGYCDRFFVCHKRFILQALDILPPFLNAYNPDIYGKLHNPEGLLKATWKRKNLRAGWFSRGMFTCSSDGDHSRWRVPEKQNKVEEGVYKKYIGEYAVARKTCTKTRMFNGVFRDRG